MGRTLQAHPPPGGRGDTPRRGDICLRSFFQLAVGRRLILLAAGALVAGAAATRHRPEADLDDPHRHRVGAVLASEGRVRPLALGSPTPADTPAPPAAAAHRAEHAEPQRVAQQAEAQALLDDV